MNKIIKSISESHILTISITGDVNNLIVGDEGKSPPVYHEYYDLVSGWTEDIEFEDILNVIQLNWRTLSFQSMAVLQKKLVVIEMEQEHLVGSLNSRES